MPNNETPTLIGIAMNENQKTKLAQIKKKIKTYAPAVIAYGAAAASIVLTVKTIQKAATAATPSDDVSAYEMSEVTGDAKTELLAREDLVVQDAGLDDVYVLSVMPTPTTEQ